MGKTLEPQGHMTWNLVKICLKGIKLKSENLSLIAFLEKKLSQKSWGMGVILTPHPPMVQIGLNSLLVGARDLF